MCTQLCMCERVPDVRLTSPASPLSACLEICLLQIARALGEVLQSAMRTSQTESETGGISSYTPINRADAKAQLASPVIFHSTEPKNRGISAPHGFLTACKTCQS